MKFQLQSDIHLEFDGLFRPFNQGADVLILAGDICVADYFTRSEDSPYHMEALTYKAFFKHVSEQFPHVIYLQGNHESYNGRLDKTKAILTEALAEFPNIHVMDRDVLELGGVRFVVATLWTDMNNNCPITDRIIAEGMNDYRIIKYDDGRHIGRLYPEQTKLIHRDTVKWIQEVVQGHDNVVVCTHMAPTKMSIHPRYVNDHYMNGAYSSNLDNLILDNPQIRVWIHGHIHSSCAYYAGDTFVSCNPKGYYNENKGFDPNYVIDMHNLPAKFDAVRWKG